MPAYKILTHQKYEHGEFILVPIRYEDRMDIMQWRNEQIYHLRQTRPLTIEDQENYFANVITQLFNQEKPQQMLFSLLKNNECIGYGGLVHINWEDHHAEISFIMNTRLEKDFFKEIWTSYLHLIQKVAFDELNLHKIYTYAYDLRPHLYPVFEHMGFSREAVLKDHKYFEKKYVDVVIHAKLKNYERN